MKTIQVDGKRYRLSWIGYHRLVVLNGPGILAGIYLPDGVTLETPRPVLADAVRVAIADYHQRRKDARESLRKYFKGQGY